MKLKQALSKILGLKLIDKMSPEEISDFEMRLHECVESHIQLINKQNILEWVNIRNVLYIQRDNKFACFFTRHGEYKHYLTFETVLQFVEKFNFDITDGRILVNMNEVRKFDSDSKKIYFDDEILPSSCFTTYSVANKQKIIDLLGVENDLDLIRKQKDGINVVGKLFRQNY